MMKAGSCTNERLYDTIMLQYSGIVKYIQSNRRPLCDWYMNSYDKSAFMQYWSQNQAAIYDNADEETR